MDKKRPPSEKSAARKLVSMKERKKAKSERKRLDRERNQKLRDARDLFDLIGVGE